MSDGRKVLVCCERFPTVSETFVVEHILGLHRNGWNARVACLEWDLPAWERIVSARLDGDTEQARSLLGVSYAPTLDRLLRSGLARQGFLVRELGWRYRGKTNGLNRRARIRAAILCRYIRQWQPAAVHAHFGPHAVQAAVAVNGTGVPLIAEFHGFDVTSYPAKHGWELYRRHLSDCKIIVHSEFVARQLKHGAGLESEQIPFGIDPGRFAPPSRADSWPDVVKILVAGRLVYHKGQETAIRSLARLHGRQFELTVVGDGEDAGDLQGLTRELGLNGRVNFVGSVPHETVASLMAENNILVVPSRRSPKGSEEGFCLVAAEGLAMGMTVVGTDCGGLGDTIGPGGIVVGQNDVDALTAGIMEAMASGSPREWSERATTRAKSFDVATMHAGYERILEDAVRDA